MLLALMSGLALAQSPARPFPNHEPPPEGWHCLPARDAKDVQTNPHACDCRGMFMDDPEPFCHVPGEDEDGNQIRMPRAESPTCKVFCHKDHCTCVKRCEDS